MKTDFAEGEGGKPNMDLDINKLVDLQTFQKLADKVDKLWDMFLKFKDQTTNEIIGIHDELSNKADKHELIDLENRFVDRLNELVK